jgi:general secretion pathway protein G
MTPQRPVNLACATAPRRGRALHALASRGFTLIELMVVMVLIALLLTIAVPRYFGTVDNGKLSVQRQNIAAIRDAIDHFYGDLGRYPEPLEELVDKRYLRSVPVDPVTEQPNWIIVVPTNTDQTGVYDIKAAGSKNSAGAGNG